MTGVVNLHWRASAMASGEHLCDIPLVAGEITADTGASPARVATLTVPGVDEWIPSVEHHPLRPDSRADIVIERLAENDTWVSEGIFVVAETETVRSTKGTNIRVICPDRTQLVKRVIVTAPLSFPSGTQVETAIAEILSEHAPWLTYDLANTNTSLPPTWAGKIGDNPWDIAEGLAKVASMELIINRQGVAVLRSMGAPADEDVVDTITVDGSSPVTNIRWKLDGTTMPDAAIVQWRRGGVLVGANPPINPILWNGDPSLVLSEAQANTIGAAYLAKHKGMAEHITVSMLNSNDLDVADAVRVVDSVSGIDYSSRVTSVRKNFGSPVVELQLASRRASV